MARNPAVPQLAVVAAAIVVGSIGFVALRTGDPATIELSAVDVAEIAANGVTPVVARSHLTLPPAPTGLSAATAGTPAVAGESPATEGSEPVATEPAAEVAPTTMAPQPAPKTGGGEKTYDQKQDHGHGYDLHNYVDHVGSQLGTQMLAPGQGQYGGYEFVGPDTIQARAPITGLRPVIEQAISDVKERNRDLTGQQLESKIAQRLTDLNDWKDLNPETQAKMMLLSGINIAAMSKDERENTVNHLLHSPQPFGDLEEVLTPNVRIDLGYTHTLDKKWTNVEDLGNGLFRIWMVSNNNNGSHTGHSLGSFRVQLPAGTSVGQAKEIGNKMVVNKNDNDKLYLDVAARNVLYGQTPILDFTKREPEPTTSTTALIPEPEMESVTTAPPTTAAPDTTDTGPATTATGQTTATTAPAPVTSEAATSTEGPTTTNP